jgi:hypothetical protein
MGLRCNIGDCVALKKMFHGASGEAMTDKEAMMCMPGGKSGSDRSSTKVHTSKSSGIGSKEALRRAAGIMLTTGASHQYRNVC